MIVDGVCLASLSMGATSKHNLNSHLISSQLTGVVVRLFFYLAVAAMIFLWK